MRHIETVRELLRVKGFRPVTLADLKPGNELLRVEVEKFHTSGMMAGLTVIELDRNPIKQSQADSSKKLVFYHCLSPVQNVLCLVPLEEFVRNDYTPARNGTTHSNEYRFFATYIAKASEGDVIPQRAPNTESPNAPPGWGLFYSPKAKRQFCKKLG